MLKVFHVHDGFLENALQDFSMASLSEFTTDSSAVTFLCNEMKLDVKRSEDVGTLQGCFNDLLTAWRDLSASLSSSSSQSTTTLHQVEAILNLNKKIHEFHRTLPDRGNVAGVFKSLLGKFEILLVQSITGSLPIFVLTYVKQIHLVSGSWLIALNKIYGSAVKNANTEAVNIKELERCVADCLDVIASFVVNETPAPGTGLPPPDDSEKIKKSSPITIINSPGQENGGRKQDNWGRSKSSGELLHQLDPLISDADEAFNAEAFKVFLTLDDKVKGGTVLTLIDLFINPSLDDSGPFHQEFFATFLFCFPAFITPGSLICTIANRYENLLKLYSC